MRIGSTNPQGSHVAVTEDPVLAALADGIGAQEPESLVAQRAVRWMLQIQVLEADFPLISTGKFISFHRERCREIQVIHGNQGRHLKFVGDL